jgi:hypothetical protein
MAHGRETSGINPIIAFDFRMTNVFVYAATLQQRYSELGKVANDIKKKQKLDVVQDKKFPALKRKWFLVKDYLAANPTASEDEQADFANDILNSSSNNLIPNPVAAQQSWAITGFISNASRGRGAPTHQQASPGSNEGTNRFNDPDFIARLRPLEQQFPVLSKITEQIYNCLADDLQALENKYLRDYVHRITSGAQKRLNDRASVTRDFTFREVTDRALQHLLGGLRDAMNTTAT